MVIPFIRARIKKLLNPKKLPANPKTKRKRTLPKKKNKKNLSTTDPPSKLTKMSLAYATYMPHSTTPSFMSLIFQEGKHIAELPEE